MRPASGTWGSLPPAALAWAMLLGGASAAVYHAALGALLLVSCAVCLALGRWGEEAFGRKDASQIVADEVAGMCVTLALLHPAVTPLVAFDFWSASLTVGGSFVLFRVMDIVKPPPARGLQRLGGGLGVLIDDLIAGAYALGAVQLALRLLA